MDIGLHLVVMEYGGNNNFDRNDKKGYMAVDRWY